MKEWKFENGITVNEIEYDYDLHAFEVYHNEELLGAIYPADIEDMQECISKLDEGEDPISGGWEDGCGHPCVIEGWA